MHFLLHLVSYSLVKFKILVKNQFLKYLINQKKIGNKNNYLDIKYVETGKLSS